MKLTKLQIFLILLSVIMIIITLYLVLKNSNNRAQNSQNGMNGGDDSSSPPGGSLPGDPPNTPPYTPPGEDPPPGPGTDPPPVMNDYAEIYYSGTEFYPEITVKYYNHNSQENAQIGTNPQSIVGLIDALYRRGDINENQAEFLQDWVNLQDDHQP